VKTLIGRIHPDVQFNLDGTIVSRLGFVSIVEERIDISVRQSLPSSRELRLPFNVFRRIRGWRKAMS